MKLADEYAYWDLIAQEAYIPEESELISADYHRFASEAVDKEIWLFGCNPACEAFINRNDDEYRIAGILDNSKIWAGKSFAGKRVFSPSEISKSIAEDDSIVIIALRLHADNVYRQLKNMGVKHIYSLGVLLSEISPYKEFISEVECLKKNKICDNQILIESMSDFDGNTGALYQYLKNLYENKYSFIWILKERVSKSKLIDDNDMALCPDNVTDLKEYVRIRATAKWEIWECDSIRKVRKDQVNIFLQHYGMGYKQVAHLYNSPSYVDYVLTTTPLVYEYEKKSITYGENTKVIYGELPRNDELYQAYKNIPENGKRPETEKLTGKSYNKMVLWAPTLRESRYYNRVDSDSEYPYGVSLIYTAEDLGRLDVFLAHRNILLIIKPHPRQKHNFSDQDYDNIIYLSGTRTANVSGYRLMAEADALITDYSSIVFDYMLLDRPVAWVLEDREHYKIDYLMDNPDDYMPGDRIYSIDNMFSFLQDICDGVDRHKIERRDICDRCNLPFEGKGSENLVRKFGL